MLYVQCSACRSIGPLICSGTMWPHMPTPAVQTPFGAVCPACSSVGTGFTCPRCMTAQLFLMPGARPPLYGGGQQYAPVVQAGKNASESKLLKLFEAVAPVVGDVITGVLGQSSSGGGSPWQQYGGYSW